MFGYKGAPDYNEQFTLHLFTRYERHTVFSVILDLYYLLNKNQIEKFLNYFRVGGLYPMAYVIEAVTSSFNTECACLQVTFSV